MIQYNTALPKLEMREYGRHIQQMVENCLKIENKKERTEYAHGIAEIMTGLFPELSSDDLPNKKVWDHIHMISGFKLDIDYPVEVLKETELNPKPMSIPYSQKTDTFRCYGNNLIRMIKEVSKLEGGIEKDNLIFLIANQMKKLLMNVSAESATDRRVFKDIKEISEGSIDIDPDSYRLNDYIGLETGNESKKKKKK